MPLPPFICYRSLANIAQEQKLQSLSEKLEESESERRAVVAVEGALEKVHPTSFGSRIFLTTT